MAQLTEGEVELGDLLLDPNNYRFQADEDFVRADDARAHEETVQDRAYNRLRREDLAALKNSILTNGFLPFERLVVRRYTPAEGKYLVLEGNRRVAALRWIERDHEAGVSVPAELVETLNGIPVIVVDKGRGRPDAAAGAYGCSSRRRHPRVGSLPACAARHGAPRRPSARYVGYRDAARDDRA